MRLPRPHIPLAVRIEVASRQLQVVEPARAASILYGLDESMPLAKRLARLLQALQLAEPHLDHDPPLAARSKIRRGGVIIGYRPAANDPRFLIYRTAVDHRLKTNVRGDHGQHPDRVLIKKARRLERGVKKPALKRGRKNYRQWPKRPFPKGRGFSRRTP